jgi:snRNA-activating protein complex subunit 3
MNSDYNVLTGVVSMSIYPLTHRVLMFLQKCASNSDSIEVSPEGVVVVSIHDRVPWGPSYVTRSSQHALLCSQTLRDLYDGIPCISKQLPTNNLTAKDRSRGVICIEGQAFSDVHNEGEDYAE